MVQGQASYILPSLWGCCANISRLHSTEHLTSQEEEAVPKWAIAASRFVIGIGINLNIQLTQKYMSKVNKLKRTLALPMSLHVEAN